MALEGIWRGGWQPPENLVCSGGAVRLVRIDWLSPTLGVGLAILGWLFVWFRVAATSVLLDFLVGLILAASLAPLVTLLRKPRRPPGGWRPPMSVVVFLIDLAIAALIAGLAFFLTRPLQSELGALSGSLTVASSHPLAHPNGLLDAFGLGSLAEASLSGLIRQLRVMLVNFGSVLSFVVVNVSASVVDTFVGLTFAFFLLVEGDAVVSFWLRLFPLSQRQRVRQLTVRMGRHRGA
jgi:predicted PurR-regulated permease PerM